jgi:hypothetical protein
LHETDKIEVYRGSAHVGTLTGRALALLVEHQMLAVEVNGWLHPPDVPPPTPRRPPQPLPPRVPFTPEERVAKKDQRRTRRKT